MNSTCFPERHFIGPETAALGGVGPAERSAAMLSLIFDGIDQSGKHVAPVYYRCDARSPYPFTHLSGSVTTHLGCDPGELIGKPRFSLETNCWSEDAPEPERLPRLFARGAHVGECHLRHQDGRMIRFRDEMRLLRDQHGEPMQIAGCLTALED
jgi:PAS domain-containing protein